MCVWYFHLEGVGHPNAENGATQEFGFFVHALALADERDEALATVREDLLQDGLEVSNVRFQGKFDEFLWEDGELEHELRELSIEAQKTRKPRFSKFFRWETPAH